MKTKKVLAACAASMAIIASLSMTTGCNKKESDASQAADVLEPETEAVTEPEEYPDIENFSPEPDGMLGRARALRDINDDVVGYIRISNTYIDYPVVQYDGENLDENGNAYYMDKDIYGNYLDSGTIFMDYRDNFGPDKSQQSQNIMLYGHNMLNGTKFATLHYYRQDDTFYDDNPIIEFSSNYNDYKYIIFGYFITSGSYGESAYGPEFAYWDMENMDEKEFNEYVETVRDRSVISPDIDVEYGDQLITLQTCYMDEDNSRMLVVGRRLREHETADNIDKASTAKTESDDSDVSESDESQE